MNFCYTIPVEEITLKLDVDLSVINCFGNEYDIDLVPDRKFSVQKRLCDDDALEITTDKTNLQEVFDILTSEKASKKLISIFHKELNKHDSPKGCDKEPLSPVSESEEFFPRHVVSGI